MCKFYFLNGLALTNIVRKNIGYLYAIHHGARMVYDFDMENLVVTNLPKIITDFVEVIYPTGDVWNPYKDLANLTNTWPRGFPPDQANKEQRVLAEKREEIRMSSVGVIQSLIAGAPDIAEFSQRPHFGRYFPDLKTPRILAVGLKTLVPLNARSTLFKEDVFWGLFLPVGLGVGLSDIWRGYVMQKIMWKVGSNVAYSTPWVSDDKTRHDDVSGADVVNEKVEMLVRRIIDMELICDDIPACINGLEKILVILNRTYY